jgi:hypothetical protein
MKLKEWWTSGNKFQRQEEFYQSLQRSHVQTPSRYSSSTSRFGPIGPPSRVTDGTATSKPANSSGFDMTRLLIPVLENLSSYVQGPVDQRRDYFSQWSQPPEWAIDNSPEGNNSFYDKDWGTPPARVGRDPRYSGSRWPGSQQTPLRGRNTSSSYGSPAGVVLGSGGGFGLDRRFAFASGGRY